MPTFLDLTPKFQTFFALARGTDPDTRWTLWQKHYGFAAVPPVPEGSQMARELLDAAWDRYADLPADLSHEVRRLQDQAERAAARLERLFGTPVPEYRLVTYVGGFEGNAFVAQQSVCLPVEMPAAWAERVVTHELAHLFHQKLSGGTGDWTRTLAALIVQEGLATRTTQAMFPERGPAQHVGEPEWLATCEANREALIRDALPRLAQTDDATLRRFIGPHPALGVDRTAYALGWWWVGEWLQDGHSLAELARVPEAELPELVVARWNK